jgi:phosphoglycerol transferase MdoB-like AlkP superfamily enzyme
MESDKSIKPLVKVVNYAMDIFAQQKRPILSLSSAMQSHQRWTYTEKKNMYYHRDVQGYNSFTTTEHGNGYSH